MTDESTKVVSAELTIDAPAATIFELIADPSRQPEWDGNDNLASSPSGHRVTAVGDTFGMTLSKGVDRENTVVEFDEGRLIAWKPSEVGGAPFGQKWKWEVESIDDTHALARQTYDWTGLPADQEARIRRAKSTTADKLLASMTKLKALAEE